MKTIKELTDALAVIQKAGEALEYRGFDVRISADPTSGLGPRISLDYKVTEDDGWDFKGYTADSWAPEDLEEAFLRAENHIISLPTVEEARKEKFIAALGNLIDRGRKEGIELVDGHDIMADLEATMKRLSENVITHQPIID